MRRPYIDPLESSTNNYKLLLWDGNRRMIEMHLPAGEKDTLHSHQESLIYFLKGGKLRLNVRDGDPRELAPADGEAIVYESWTGSVSNTGETDVHAIIFETMTVRSSAGG